MKSLPRFIKTVTLASFATAQAFLNVACDSKQLRETDIAVPDGGRILLQTYDTGSDEPTPDEAFRPNQLLRTSTAPGINFPTVSQNTAFRFIGHLTIPRTGRYVLCSCSDDGIRTFLDNELVIDYWQGQGARFWWSNQVFNLRRGDRLPFRVDYYNGGGPGQMQMYWAYNPPENLEPNEVCVNSRPATATDNVDPYDCAMGGTYGPNEMLELIGAQYMSAGEDMPGELRKACEVQPTYLSFDSLPAITPAVQKAQTLYRRLTGTDIPIFDTRVHEMAKLIAAGASKEAAHIATEDPSFLQNVVRSFATRMSNVTEDPAAKLNDMSATIVGVTRDRIDARKLLTGDFLYRADPKAFWLDMSLYTRNPLLETGRHYDEFSNLDIPLKCGLSKIDRLNLIQLPEYLKQKVAVPDFTGGGGGRPIDNTLAGQAVNNQLVYNVREEVNPDPAGVLTSRQFSKISYIAGTNRAAIRNSFNKFLCRDIEEWRSDQIPDLYVGRDVMRLPAGPGSHGDYLTVCKTCHAPMDGMRGAFSYYNYVEVGAPEDDRGFTQYSRFWADRPLPVTENANVDVSRIKLTYEIHRNDPLILDALVARRNFQENGANSGDFSFDANPITRPRATPINGSSPFYELLENPVVRKFNHNVRYAAGYFVEDDSFDNLLTTDAHMRMFGWSGYMQGHGAREFGRMLANSRAFPGCMTRRVFKEVCRIDPFTAEFKSNNAAVDEWLDTVADEFAKRGFDLRDLFESVAPACIE